VAGELTDLEAVARQLERFRRSKTLPDHQLDELWRLVQARHQRLLGTPSKEPAQPVAPVPLAMPIPEARTPSEAKPPEPIVTHKAPTAPGWVETRSIEPVRNGLSMAATEQIPTVLPVYSDRNNGAEPGSEPPAWRRLQLLLEHRDAAELNSSDRIRVVLWYRQSPVERLETLPARTQLRLAHILQDSGLEREALRTYQRFLVQHPRDPEFVGAALAVGRLATRLDPPAARELWQELANRPLSPEQREEVRQLATLLPRPEMGPAPVDTAREHLPPTPATPPPAVSPPRQRSGWNDLLAAFMEERNILWGELVGGLLIVGGSIALVVSLWNNLKENPYFPFGIFAAVTLGLFGAGLYTWRHWKLETTSRGLLTIATLMVPLSFLVMPRMLGEQNDPLELAIAGVALAVFSWCLVRAAQVLVPDLAALLPLGVLGSCVGQLVGVRSLTENQPDLAVVLGLIPLAGYASATGCLIHRLRQSPVLQANGPQSLLVLLGLSFFATAVGLGFLVVHCLDWLLALKVTTPLLAACGIPMLAGGFLLHQRLSGDQDQACLRATGTGVLLTGLAVMLVALGLAWPFAGTMTVVCVVSLVALLWIAFRHDFSLAHVPAVIFLIAGYLMSFAWSEQTPALAEAMLQQLGSMSTAMRLVWLGLGLVVATEGLVRWRRPHALAYIGGAGVVGTVAVALASWHGLSVPSDAMQVFTLCSLACLVANRRWAQPWLTCVGLVLLVGATLWGLRAGLPGELATWSAVLAGETLLLGLLGAVLARARTVSSDEQVTIAESHFAWRKVYGLPLLYGVEGMAILAIGFALWSRWQQTSWELAHIVAGLFLLPVYPLLTAVLRRPSCATLSGLVLVGTAAAAAEVLSGALAFVDPQAVIAVTVAGAAASMAVISQIIWFGVDADKQVDLDKSPWYSLLLLGWREVIVTAGLLALWLTVRDETLLSGQVHTLTFVMVACAAWLLVRLYRAVVLGWIGSLILLIAFLHGLNWLTEMPPVQVARTAVLLHATLHLGIALALLGLRRRTAVWSTAQQFFVRPLVLIGLSTSFLSLPLFLVDPGPVLPRALDATWLAALWTVVAWSHRWRWLLAASQLASILAVVFGVMAWLTGQDWMHDHVSGIWDPRSLQAFGVGLALLCGFWTAARIGLQRQQTAQLLLLPDWPGVDRVLLGVLVVAQLGLVDWAVLREVVVELTPRGVAPLLEWWPAASAEALGPGGLVLLGTLAAVLALSLWQPPPTRRQSLAVLGLATVVMSLPAFWAGAFVMTRASASALRWGLALVFLAVSVVVWLRQPLLSLTGLLHVPRPASGNSRRVRFLLLDGALVPVLLLTIVAAGLRFLGWELAGPSDGTFFWSLDEILSLCLPLGILTAALVGHSVREQSPGYAFSAGQVLLLAVSGGYALFLLPDHPIFGDRQWVQLLQVTALVMATWAVSWLTLRRWVTGLGGEPNPLTKPLLEVQVAMPAAISVCVLAIGVAFMIGMPDPALLMPGDVWYPPPAAWTVAAGGVLGWLALAMTTVALGAWWQRSISVRQIGSFLLALIALIACTVAGLWPDWAFRSILLGLAGFALGWAAFILRIMRSKKIGESLIEEVSRKSETWVQIAALLLLALGLEAALVHQDRLFASMILTAAAVAILVVGLARRREGKLLGGGLMLAIAMSLAVWHFHLEDSFGQWWLLLLQLDGTVLMLVALGWLWLCPISAQPRQPQFNRLTWLVVLGSAPLAIVLGLILPAAVYDPIVLPFFLAEPASRWTGWLQALVTVTALLWYATRAWPNQRAHFLGGVGIMLIVQAAATLSRWDDANWLTYHGLVVGLALLGFGLASGGWIATSLGELGPRAWSAERREQFARGLLHWFPALRTQCWVEALGLALVVLAFRAGAEDAGRPWWPALTMSLSVMLAIVLLCWTRRAGYLGAIGGMLAATGLVVWLGSGQGALRRLVLYSVLAVAVASLVTGFLDRRLRGANGKLVCKRLTLADYAGEFTLRAFVCLFLIFLFWAGWGVWSLDPTNSPNWYLIFGVFALLFVIIQAAWSTRMPPDASKVDEEQTTALSGQCSLLGLNLLATLLLIGLGADLSGMSIHVAGPLAWCAWGTLFAATVVGALADSRRTAPLAGLSCYAGGFLGVLLGLHQLSLEPAVLCWLAAPLLAGYVLLACLVAFVARRLLFATRSESARDVSGLSQWFLALQLAPSGLALILALWISCTRDTVAERLLAPASALLLILAFWLMARSTGAAQPTSDTVIRPNHLRLATLILGSILALFLGWAILDPFDLHVSLLRHAVLLTTLGGITVLYGVGLPRLLSAAGSWNAAGRNLARVYWLLSLLVVATMTAHEYLLYQPRVHTYSMDLWAIGVVAITMVALIASSVWFALRPAHDPFTLPERRRTLYVYAAEFLLFLLFFHLRVSAPVLFGGSLRQYAPIILMGIAFLGVGLSELFSRQNLPVLAIPLQKTGIFLPLIPLLTFWFSTGDLWQLILGTRTSTPQSVPAQSLDFARYSVYWFLAGGLYVMVGALRRSPWFALLAALAVNFGFWSLLFHNRDFGVGFFAHPQLWLIPVAVIVLVAEYINRDRLAPSASQTLRYFGLVVIYLSSTTDLFIAGLDDLAMSLVLLVLSLIGILAGIQLRIKAFLFTGLVFLVLVIFARIWHAAVDLRQTWVWWAALIALGAAILALFAVFEKRRTDVLRMLDEFKNWK
jgi:hypothetical protein